MNFSSERIGEPEIQCVVCKKWQLESNALMGVVGGMVWYECVFCGHKFSEHQENEEGTE